VQAIICICLFSIAFVQKNAVWPAKNLADTARRSVVLATSLQHQLTVRPVLPVKALSWCKQKRKERRPVARRPQQQLLNTGLLNCIRMQFIPGSVLQ